jgi:threonine/homoserine/homoserine lactone efflux protein
MWIEFLLTSLVVVVAPGTGVLYTLGIGLARGFGPSVAAAIGCTFGIVPHLAAAISGLAALLQASPTAFAVFRAVGVAYLLWMAWSVLREDGTLDIRPAGDARATLRIAMTGALINVLNPKLSIFFLAFLPQFVPAATTAPIARMLLLGGIFMALTFVVFVGYGAFAARIGRHMAGRPAIVLWMRRAFAATFAALALRLLLAG